MKQKKSQGLSLNVIIIAAIGLIVLIVILAIFTGKAHFFSKSVGNNCKDRGGICASEDGSVDGNCDNSAYPIKIIAKDCPHYKSVFKLRKEIVEGRVIEIKVMEWVKDDKKEGGQCCLPIG